MLDTGLIVFSVRVMVGGTVILFMVGCICKRLSKVGGLWKKVREGDLGDKVEIE